MADQEFTVEHLGATLGPFVDAEPEPLEAQAAADAMAHGAADVAHETPVQQVGHVMPGVAATLQSAVQAGVIQAQAQPAYSPVSNTQDAASASSISAAASTYDDKPEHTSALAAPLEATPAAEEPKHDPEPVPAEAAHPEPAAAHEPEPAHTDAPADVGGDHSA